MPSTLGTEFLGKLGLVLVINENYCLDSAVPNLSLCRHDDPDIRNNKCLGKNFEC